MCVLHSRRARRPPQPLPLPLSASLAAERHPLPAASVFNRRSLSLRCLESRAPATVCRSELHILTAERPYFHPCATICAFVKTSGTKYNCFLLKVEENKNAYSVSQQNSSTMIMEVDRLLMLKMKYRSVGMNLLLGKGKNFSLHHHSYFHLFKQKFYESEA
ncbi:unnamed protein product [Victoria cruziana]